MQVEVAYNNRLSSYYKQVEIARSNRLSDYYKRIKSYPAL
jgi:hypothetical protein